MKVSTTKKVRTSFPVTADAEDGRLCRICNHVFDEHLIVATTDDPLKGGVVLCHLIGCQCFSTWGVNAGGVQQGVERIPDAFELTELRARLQTQKQETDSGVGETDTTDAGSSPEPT